MGFDSEFKGLIQYDSKETHKYMEK